MAGELRSYSYLTKNCIHIKITCSSMSYRLIYGHQESFIDRIINSSTSYFISLFHGPAVDKFLMLQLCDNKKALH